MENPAKVKYFNLFDYISKIKIDTSVLEHMEEINNKFDNYMKKISSYNSNDIVHLWLIQAAEELVNSSKIESHYVDRKELLKKNLFFDTLDISHQRIHDIHNFVLPEKQALDYRETPVHVSYFDKQGAEHIYWHGAEPEDVKQFMEDFISVYKSSDLSVINSNPFLKSALIKLLFIRIHPYRDGNGRTSRVLYSIKFTESMNKLYDSNFKICPLNISASILLNQPTYVNILDNIYFDLEHDNNEVINKWFHFMLNMSDEQLFYLGNKLKDLDLTYNNFLKHDVETSIALLDLLVDSYGIDILGNKTSEVNDEDVKIYTFKRDEKKGF